MRILIKQGKLILLYPLDHRGVAWIPALIEGEEAQGRFDQIQFIQGGPDRRPVG